MSLFEGKWKKRGGTMHEACFGTRNIDMAFAERLKAAREARKLTQTRLAELLDVSPRVYNRWEKGLATPHFDTVVKIADILKVSLDELAGRKDPAAEVLVHNHKLHSLCEHIDHLSDEDQKALIILMDSLVKRSQLTKVLTR
jgi:transcriptional regulator with XRE-family HTH domain